MKKTLSVLLTLALLCTIFAGCASSSAPSSSAEPAESSAEVPAADTPADDADAGEDAAEAPADGGGDADINEDGTVNNPEAVQVDENNLVFWSLFSGGDGGYMDQIISDYNAQTSGRKVTSIMLVWADYYTKLTTAVAANNGPDIGVSHISKLPELVSQGVVVPFDAQAEAVGTAWGDYDDSILESVTFDGEKYAIPLDTHAEILYFNKDILEEAGVALNGDGRLDFGSGEAGFKGVMEQLKGGLPEGTYPIVLTSKGDDPYRIWWATYFQMGGTPLVSEDNSTVTMDPTIAQNAMDFIKGLFDEGYIIPGIAENHGKVFQAGQGALFFGGTWTTGTFESTDNFNFGAQAFPTIFDKAACWADSHVMIIPHNRDRDDEQTQDSVDFISWASSQGGLTWSQSGQIPSNNVVLNSSEYKALPFRSDYAEAAKDAVYPSSSENFYAIKELLIRNLDDVWSGNATSADVVQNILSEMETAIS